MDLDSINEFYYKHYEKYYDDAIYFQGDFSKSIDQIEEERKNEYGLFKNNCMQVSVDLLLEGEFKYFNNEHHQILKEIREEYTIPNYAYRRIRDFSKTHTEELYIALYQSKVHSFKWNPTETVLLLN